MSQDKDSVLYAVDRTGRVWLNSQSNFPGSHGSSTRNSLSSQSQSKACHQWSLLPNPTRVDIKRVSSRNSVVWGIGSDHQIYVYVHRQDIPIRVREESFENERWNPLSGFCAQLLPTDRPHFSSEDGLNFRNKDCIKLPSEESWMWESDWQIEDTFNNELLEAGWTYAVDFPATYYSDKSWNSCVRRRKWFRIRKFTGLNKWLRIDAIHSDYTQEPFTDVSVSSFGSSHDITCVWTVTILGQIYFRAGVTPMNPEGTNWERVSIKKGLEACQITVASNGTPWYTAWTGSCLYRVGITPHNLVGTEWVEVNGPPGGLVQLSAGERSLWAISRNKKCWILKGDLQHVTGKPIGIEWNEIPYKLKSVSVSKNDMVVLGMSDNDNTIYARIGIGSDSDSNRSGQGWTPVFTHVSDDTISTTSSLSSPSVLSTDQTDSGQGDSISTHSVGPDFPGNFQLEESTEEEISFCCVDGGCLSSLKGANEGDLEVGPWRDEILNGLQFLKVAQENFAYPNAVEQDESEWRGKSTTARMLQHGQESHWVKGQLEVINNDTLVFHKDLTHTWLCGLKDVLSVLRPREFSSSNSFTLRIRNAIEAGVADFVSFKFTSGKELDDWHATVTELSEKNSEEFSLGNLWLTTNNGELHECGLVKMADTAVGADMVVPSDSGYTSHHPLIKGFLPGSTLKLDISVPASAEAFMLNLEGKNLIAFHFNPRFPDQQVVRNTKRNGVWGVEERDGVFPFQPATKYSVLLECIDTHFITTVAIDRKKFSYKYRHRVLPRFITNFSSGGNVNILGVRYDPKTGDNSALPEFVTTPAPGHFWKVESVPNGFIWAIGFDSNVWMYGSSGKINKKLEWDRLVKDDQMCYIYENQRWNPLTGFGAHGLPTDRSPWSDETGRIPLEKDKIKVHSTQWDWVGDWDVDFTSPGGVDQSGWQYAVDFPASYHSSKRFNDFVRRRRWKRICRFSAHGPWVQVTGVKLVDLCIQMNDECDWELLGICQNGDAVVRRGISPENPIGTNWESFPAEKPFISIGSCYAQRPWAIGKDGFAYIRYGENWNLLDRPKETPLKVVRVGSSGVWAIGTNNALYRRTDILPILPEGRDWSKICDGVMQVSLGLGEEIWVLLKRGDVFQSTLAKRTGISKNHPNGLGWDLVAEGPWNHLSICGAFRRNR